MKRISNGLFAINPSGECVRVNALGGQFLHPGEGTCSQGLQMDMMDVNMTMFTMVDIAPFSEAFHTSQSALRFAFMLGL